MALPSDKLAPRKKVFVSGCFDLLHSGHVAFLQEAASYGDLYVGIGSDLTIHELKDRCTINSQAERQYLLVGSACQALSGAAQSLAGHAAIFSLPPLPGRGGRHCLRPSRRQLPLAQRLSRAVGPA